MQLLASNNAQSQLAGPITNTSTTLTLQAGSGALFPNPGPNEYFVITMIPAATPNTPGEIMWCTARTADVLTVSRGQEGTTASAYLVGDYVSNQPTAGQVIYANLQLPTYPGNPNGAIGGTAGSTTESPSAVWDSVDNLVWVCTTGGNASTAIWSQSGRVRLTGNLSLYVATTGSDSNNGLSSLTPFATIQHAANVISNYDLNGYVVTVVVASGTYSAGAQMSSTPPGYNNGIVFSSSGGTVTINGSGYCFFSIGAQFILNGTFNLVTTNASNQPNAALAASNGGRIVIEGTATTFGSSGTYHLFSGTGAQINTAPSAAYTIAGNAVAHWAAQTAGNITVLDATITLTGTPAFSTAFAQALDEGTINCAGNTFNGSATGPRWNIAGVGLIDTGNAAANYLPGNSSGVGQTQRTQLLGNNFGLYVATSGSDTGNNGLTAATPFATIQHAVAVLNQSYDLNGQDVTIAISAGTYSAGASLEGTLPGQTGAPAITFVTSGGGVTVSASGQCFAAVGAQFTLDGAFTLITTSAAGAANAAVASTNGGLVVLEGSGTVFGSSGEYHMLAAAGGQILGTGGMSYTISGGAAVHWQAQTAGNITIEEATVTLSGTPVFSAAFAQVVDGGTIDCAANTFSGTASGSRYNATNCGVINTNAAGTTYLPGSTSGTGTNPGTSPYGLYD